MVRQSTVLCVDDEPLSLRAMERMLQRDYLVLTATNGEDAMELVERYPVDLVITDHHMPGMTGLALLSHLQREKPHIRRILVSGMLDQLLLSEALDGVALDACMRKPWRVADFRAQVQQVLDRDTRQPFTVFAPP